MKINKANLNWEKLAHILQARPACPQSTAKLQGILQRGRALQLACLLRPTNLH